ncbi:hypothetical protein DSM3645_24435 [Blastopirellula marina DSM 3645]|uniref:Uncharacterized protein n=2 Tax=Blastopirellula marina TaxID=124 RepID=A3ZUX8_9BACT|nr:hypothetical protein DSM3645_24435 [Blastopirellula marina DSM 3645]
MLGIVAVVATVLFVGPVGKPAPEPSQATTARAPEVSFPAEVDLIELEEPVKASTPRTEKKVTIFLPQPITTEEQFKKAKIEADARIIQLREITEFVNKENGINLPIKDAVYRLGDCYVIPMPTGYEKYYGDGVMVRQHVISDKLAYINLFLDGVGILNIKLHDDDLMQITYNNKKTGEEAMLRIDRGKVYGGAGDITNALEAAKYAQDCMEEFLTASRLNRSE